MKTAEQLLAILFPDREFREKQLQRQKKGTKWC